MVDEHTFRGFKYGAVHRKVSFSNAIYSCPSSGVECSAVRIGVPLLFGEAIIIIRVDDGELAPCEWYSAEGVAVAEEAVEKNRKN